jgi:hypothetical protein
MAVIGMRAAKSLRQVRTGRNNCLPEPDPPPRPPSSIGTSGSSTSIFRRFSDASATSPMWLDQLSIPFCLPVAGRQQHPANQFFVVNWR